MVILDYKLMSIEEQVKNVVNAKILLRGFLPSTRGPGGTHLRCASYRANGKRWVAMCGVDNR